MLWLAKLQRLYCWSLNFAVQTLIPGIYNYKINFCTDALIIRKYQIDIYS